LDLEAGVVASAQHASGRNSVPASSIAKPLVNEFGAAISRARLRAAVASEASFPGQWGPDGPRSSLRLSLSDAKGVDIVIFAGLARKSRLLACSVDWEPRPNLPLLRADSRVVCASGTPANPLSRRSSVEPCPSTCRVPENPPQIKSGSFRDVGRICGIGLKLLHSGLMVIKPNNNPELAAFDPQLG
jgi:hypothetical protein